MENEKDIQSNTVKKSNAKPNIKFILFLSVFVILLIANFILLYFISKNEKAAQGADTVIKLSAQGGFDCDYAEAQKLYPFSDGVLKVTNDRVAFLTLSGNEVYSSSVNYQNPFCVVENGYAAVMDINGYSYSVYSDKGQIMKISTEDKVKSVAISDTGLSAVIVDKENAYGQILIYDASGKVLGQWISYSSGYPVSLKFSKNSQYLAVSVLNTSGAAVESTVKLIKLVQTDKKIEMIDYAVYSLDESKIVLSVLFADNENLYAFCADSYYVIDASGNIKTVAFDSGIINYSFAVNNNICIIYSDGVDQINKLQIISSDDGKVIYDSVIGTDVFAFNVFEDRFVIGVDRRVFVFDSDGNIESDTEIDEDVIRLGIMGKKKIIVISTTGVHTINY
ncbi:MAG: DUF5711 family protein [Clostridia bacterium]|nr:DUF5711 family protein [Clostridia bacterium]